MAEWSRARILMVSPCRPMLKVKGSNPAECAQLFSSTPLWRLGAETKISVQCIHPFQFGGALQKKFVIKK